MLLGKKSTVGTHLLQAVNDQTNLAVINTLDKISSILQINRSYDSTSFAFSFYQYEILHNLNHLLNVGSYNLPFYDPYLCLNHHITTT